jgi:hypothetical protein
MISSILDYNATLLHIKSLLLNFVHQNSVVYKLVLIMKKDVH